MDMKPGGNMFRLIWGISSGWHHALPTPNFFMSWRCDSQREICFDLSRL